METPMLASGGGAATEAKMPKSLLKEEAGWADYVHDIKGGTNLGMMVMWMIMGHIGSEGGTVQEGHELAMGLTGVKGLMSNCDHEMNVGTVNVGLGMVMKHKGTARKVAICVVATMARAPRVVLNMFSTRLTVALGCNAEVRVEVVAGWALGLTPPQRLILAIRGDNCRMVHEVREQCKGQVDAMMGTLKVANSDDRKGTYERRHEGAPVRAMTLDGCCRGNEDPTGCTSHTCRAKVMSVRARCQRDRAM